MCCQQALNVLAVSGYACCEWSTAWQIRSLMFVAPVVADPTLSMSLLYITTGISGEAVAWYDPIANWACQFFGTALPSVFTESGKVSDVWVLCLF